MIIIDILLFPLKLIGYILIYFYRFAISPLLPHSCRYTPSCSTYAITALRKFGFIRGTFMAINRILRCNPKSKGGFDPVPLNIKGDMKWLV